MKAGAARDGDSPLAYKDGENGGVGGEHSNQTNCYPADQETQSGPLDSGGATEKAEVHRYPPQGVENGPYKSQLGEFQLDGTGWTGRGDRKEVGEASIDSHYPNPKLEGLEGALRGIGGNLVSWVSRRRGSSETGVRHTR